MGHFWAGVIWWVCIILSAAWIVFGMDILHRYGYSWDDPQRTDANRTWWRVFASLFFFYLILCTCGVTPYG